MFLTGKIKLRDRRVLSMLQERGLQHAELFYGPQKIWWTIAAVVLAGLATLAPMIWKWIGWYCLPVVLLYVVLGFIVSGYYCNSIALTDEELIIVNPNFLFKKISRFPLGSIRLVAMGQGHNPLVACFFLSECNYVEIGTDTGLQRYYCAGIDEHDGYGEEGLTEKTLEELALSLEKKHVVTRSDFRQ